MAFYFGLKESKQSEEVAGHDGRGLLCTCKVFCPFHLQHHRGLGNGGLAIWNNVNIF